jgi:hypothetical protein
MEALPSTKGKFGQHCEAGPYPVSQFFDLEDPASSLFTEVFVALDWRPPVVQSLPSRISRVSIAEIRASASRSASALVCTEWEPKTRS